MKVSELTAALSALPQDKDVYAGVLGEYAPSLAPLTSVNLEDALDGVRLMAGTEPPRDTAPHDDVTVRELIAVLLSCEMDMPVRATHIKCGIGHACRVGEFCIDDGALYMEIGTARALAAVERPYLTLLPHSDWKMPEDDEA